LKGRNALQLLSILLTGRARGIGRGSNAL